MSLTPKLEPRAGVGVEFGHVFGIRQSVTNLGKIVYNIRGLVKKAKGALFSA